MSNNQLEEPKGIAFYSVKTDETHYCKLEPTIQAYINSSDMGINASRGQDFGWRLAAEWVKRVKAFRRDPNAMQLLTVRNQGQKPTTVQILYHLYGEEVRAYQEELDENENPFEEQYQRDIATGANQNEPSAPDPAPANDVPEDVAEEDLEPADDPADAAAEAATSDEPQHVNRDAGDGQFVTDEEAAANPGTTVTETVKPAPKKPKSQKK